VHVIYISSSSFKKNQRNDSLTTATFILYQWQINRLLVLKEKLFWEIYGHLDILEFHLLVKK